MTQQFATLPRRPARHCHRGVDPSVLSTILSRAVMLAADDTITDAPVLAQLAR
ncbi:hypothetical protein [Micromonospora zamorensis]|uniref:hypothetical protein n=1 Tax=Micromonospora zamorensis TaxID=709883 RepID=UPI003CF6F086